MKDAALAMLAHVPPTQEVFLVGKDLSWSVASDSADSANFTCQFLANPIADTPLDERCDLFNLQTAVIDMPALVNGHAFPAATVTPHMSALFSSSYTASTKVCTRASAGSLRVAQTPQQPLLTFAAAFFFLIFFFPFHCIYTGLHMSMLV